MNAGILGLTSQEALGPYPLLGRPQAVPSVDPLVGFDPRSLPSIRLWLDASNSGSMITTATGGTPCGPDEGVGRWEDQSGNGLHVLQGIANNRPIRKVRSLNGLDGIQFDGSNDFLYAANRIMDRAVTVFLVVRPTSSTARYFYFDFGNYALSPNRTFAVEQNTYNTAGSRWGVFIAGLTAAGQATNNTYDTTLATSATPSVVSFAAVVSPRLAIHQPILLNVNGLQSGPFVRRAGDADVWGGYSPDDIVHCMIGSINNGGASLGTLNFSGTFHEFIAYNTVLTDADIRKVRLYLGNKWGISVR